MEDKQHHLKDDYQQAKEKIKKHAEYVCSVYFVSLVVWNMFQMMLV